MFDTGTLASDTIDLGRKHFGDEAVDDHKASDHGDNSALMAKFYAGDDLNEEECEQAIGLFMDGLFGAAAGDEDESEEEPAEELADC